MASILAACSSLQSALDQTVKPSTTTDRCQTWFNSSGVNPSDKNCDLECSTIPIDLGTFSCGLQCEDFCKTPCSSLNYNWLKTKRPDNWLRSSEKSHSWSNTEQQQVAKILASAPESLLSHLGYVFRLDTSSIFNDNPATTAHSGEIALYNPFFSGPNNTTEVLFHELGHALFNQLSDQDKLSYATTAKWSFSKGHWTFGRRPDEVLRTNSMRRIGEDFADNIAGYLLKPDALKTMCPDIFKWLKSKLGPDFHPRKPCDK